MITKRYSKAQSNCNDNDLSKICKFYAKNLIELILSIIKERFTEMMSQELAGVLISNLDNNNTLKLDDTWLIETIPGTYYHIPQIEGDNRLTCLSKQFVALKFDNLKESNESRELFICRHESCTKIVSNIFNFFDHLRSHTKEKPFGCMYPDCGKRYSQIGNLNAHIKRNGHKGNF